MKWYTAIGIKKENADGRFCVRGNAEEKILTGMEIQIWSALLWVFCEEQEIFRRVKSILLIAFGEDKTRQRINEAEFTYCLRRLERRGLVASCEAETIEAAVERMVRGMTMAPRDNENRLRLFLNSISLGKGIRFSMRAFQKEELTGKERQLLECLKKDGNIDRYLKRLSEQAAQFNLIFKESDNTLEEDAQRDFLADVVSLYGKKQLVIESIQKED